MNAGVTDFAPAVDAHHHLWDAVENKYPYLTDGSRTRMHGKPLPLRYRIDDYKRDIAGLNIGKSVHIQCGWNPADPVGETHWLEGIARDHGYPHAIVAHADLSAPDVETVLAAHAAASPRLRGIRQHIGWHENPRYRLGPRADMLTEAAWRRGYALLEKYRLTFDLQAYYPQFADAADLARAFPRTSMLVGNAGMPVDRDPSAIAGWRDGLRVLAQCPNVFVKIGGFAMVDHHWTVESIRPFVQYLIDTFGPDRCVFGSNFPTDSLYRTLRDSWADYHAVISGYSESEKRKLLSENATRVYRLGT
jgi:predicted TIM-barrel fold metal-dependent hydrolase